MINIEKAQSIILKSIGVLSSKESKLDQALDRVLAEDIYAGCDVPLLDNSAMDGFAVRARDVQGTSKDNPKVLEVVEDVRAGYLASKPVRDNQAIRIMTGAAIPQGADSVVMVEDTEKMGEDKIKIFKEIKKGTNVRRRGEDISSGELTLSKGTVLGPAHIGVLASLGRSRVKVTRRPKVAVLATGDEVIDIDEKLIPGKIRNSNTYTLCSQVLKVGGIPKNLGIAKDEIEEIKKKIKKGLDCDLILTSGGVSVGDHDLVKSVLSDMGTDIKFWEVAIKPGKPLTFGMINGIPVSGLPGNPVSSMISFEIFIKPAIFKMLGQDSDNSKKEVSAILEESIIKKKGRRHFLRAQTRWENGGYLTRATGPQGSGILKSMARANSLIILPEEKEHVEKGKKVTVRFLN
ncbi:MAG: gephyrin-like molybdotransferase Glp [Candidatus Omnitrophota bacterium]